LTDPEAIHAAAAGQCRARQFVRIGRAQIVICRPDVLEDMRGLTV
jgi:hypothetical protein